MGIRQPAVAGLFYPDNARVLNRDLDTMLDQVSAKPPGGTVVALIVPHAGYRYSGITASHSYRLIAGQSFECVVIVAPSHREYFEGISVFGGTAFRTPLGDVYVDEQLRSDLTAGDQLIAESEVGHRGEHAIEVQLPFIQKVLHDVKILPVVMGTQRREYCFHLGEKLAHVLKGKRSLLIASTDLSHYHPYDSANALDEVIIQDAARFDVERMMVDLETQHTEACGGGPMVAVLAAAHRLGADSVDILYHCNSGDVTGDYSAVVGYLSAAALRIH